MQQKQIGDSTLKLMAEFFLKTSIPRILEMEVKQNDRQRRD